MTALFGITMMVIGMVLILGPPEAVPVAASFAIVTGIAGMAYGIYGLTRRR